MERNFQTAAWLGWVKKLPDAAICSRPRLCLQLGSAFSDAGELETSEIHLQNAERALAGVRDQAEAESLLGNIALIRASNAQNRGDLAETVKYAELSLQLIPEDDSYLRAQAIITLELTHWATGNLEASLRAMGAWTNEMQKSGNQVFVIASAFAVADMQVVMSRLDEAEKTLSQAIQQAASLGREAELVTAHHHLGLALLAHEQGDDKSAAVHWQIAAEMGQRTTLVDWKHRWNLAQARLKESTAEWDAALDLLDAAKRGYVQTAIPNLHPIEAHKARVYLKQGRLDKAQDWARERSLSVTDDVSYLREYEHLTLARLLMTESRFDGVSQLLERLLELAETQKRMGSVIEILLTQVLAYQAQGSQAQALAALERVLTLAEHQGYVRTFVDEGEPIRLLILNFKLRIEKQDRNGAHPLFEYINRLLGAFPESRKAIYQSKTENLKSQVIEPLSEREMEVLRLLRSELSGPEIARRLIVSLNTLRTHTKNIFNKLGVNNRRAAVHRAEELDLF
jgi:LuxR family maltose regulon positive regulatory protein